MDAVASSSPSGEKATHITWRKGDDQEMIKVWISEASQRMQSLMGISRLGFCVSLAEAQIQQDFGV